MSNIYPLGTRHTIANKLKANLTIYPIISTKTFVQAEYQPSERYTCTDIRQYWIVVGQPPANWDETQEAIYTLEDFYIP